MTESSTTILRRMLDERGVEWGASDTYRLLVTSWSDASGHSWSFMEHRDGSFNKLTAYHLTPKQAIAAMLGSCNCPNNCTNGERTKTCVDGGTVSETYIRPTEEGSICPIPRASVIFEGQKLKFDEEDSERFAKLLERHLRKLAGVEVAE